MTSIAAGNIVLKYESGGTFRKVELAPYSIARHAVTEAQYAAVMGQGAVAAERADQPVVEVSWLDAVAFCNRLSGAAMLQPCYAIDGENVVCDFAAHGYRLPTEAEWEYACRAGSNAVRYGELDEIGWHAGNSAGRLHPVGGKSANAFGLYDTIGNAWEWCWDLYDPDVYGAYRVFRGGGWLDAPHACRASCRRKSHPTYRIDDLGFRLAQTI
ncbi:MAG TPA: SUMF1/EgtB/PvdO family nonheme iron enzyme [Burkholderiaceae bacterium]